MASVTREQLQLIRDRVLDNEGCSKNALRQSTGLNQRIVDACLDVMARSGKVYLEQVDSPGTTLGYRYRVWSSREKSSLFYKVGEEARVSSSRAIPEDVPEHPLDDLHLSCYAVWHVMRVWAQQDGTPQDDQGRPGYLWEGRKSEAISLLWPDLPTKERSLMVSRMAPWLQHPDKPNVYSLEQGRGRKKSSWWISDQYLHSGAIQKKKRGVEKSPSATEQSKDKNLQVSLRDPAPAAVADVPDQRVEALQDKLDGLQKENRRLEMRNAELETHNAQLETRVMSLSWELEQDRSSRSGVAVFNPTSDPQVRHLLLAIRQAAQVAEMVEGSSGAS